MAVSDVEEVAGKHRTFLRAECSLLAGAASCAHKVFFLGHALFMKVEKTTGQTFGLGTIGLQSALIANAVEHSLKDFHVGRVKQPAIARQRQFREPPAAAPLPSLLWRGTGWIQFGVVKDTIADRSGIVRDGVAVIAAFAC